MLSLYLIFIHLLLPLVLIFWLGHWAANSRQQWLQHWSIVTAYLIFIFLVGTWGGISYYLPVLYFFLYLFAVFRSIRLLRLGWAAQKSTHKPQAYDDAKEQWIKTVKWFAVVILATVDSWAIWGFAPHERPFDLDFPLKRGIYYVWNGGSSSPLNQCPFRHKQKHVIDLVKLNFAGVSSQSIPARGLSSYEIFGEILESPCDGAVVKVHSRSPDTRVPNQIQALDTGNMVAIECAGVTLYFLHLMDSSIVAQEGDLVKKDQYLGLVGNSGDSLEPHLHVHAERGGQSGVVFSGKSVPLRFYQRYLVRNSLICASCIF